MGGLTTKGLSGMYCLVLTSEGKTWQKRWDFLPGTVGYRNGVAPGGKLVIFYIMILKQVTQIKLFDYCEDKLR